MPKPVTIAIDFDGTLNSYDSGWTTPESIPDPPVDGAKTAVEQYLKVGFKVVVFTARAETAGGKLAIELWLAKHGFPALEVTDRKPPARVYIDDKGFHFTGEWPSVEFVRKFRSWIEK